MQHINYRILLIFLFILSISLESTGQSLFPDDQLLQPVLKTYSNADGLSQQIVRAISQDTLGFIWVGTEDGLNRFNGQDFKTFYTDRNNPNSLPDNFIYSLFHSFDGGMWVGTNSRGLTKYNPRTESFNFYKHNSDSNDVLNKGRIYCLYEEPDSTLWIGTFNQGLIKFNPYNNIFKQYTFEAERKNAPTFSIYAISQDNKRNIWVRTSTGIGNINQSINDVKHRDSDYEINNADNTGTLVIDKNDVLWTNNVDGLTKYDINSGTTENLPLFNEKHERIEVIEIIQRNEKQLWLAGYTGFYLFNKDDHTISKYGDNNNSGEEKTFNSILSMYNDSEGTLWLGRASHGLSKFRFKKKRFNLIQNIPHNKYSIKSNLVRSLHVDSKNNLWVGQISGNLDVISPDGKNKNLLTTSENNKESIDGFATTIIETTKNEIWVGTWGNGILIFSGAGDKIKMKKPDGMSLDSANLQIIHCLFEDSYNNIWVGTETELVIYNPESKKQRHFKNNPKSKNSITPLGVQSNCIVEDKEGNFWIGTWGGLTKMTQKSEGINPIDSEFSYEQFTNETDKQFKLPDNRVISLYYNHTLFPNKIFVGTYGGGLVQLKLSSNNEVDSLYIFNRLKGLPNDVIFGIESADSKHLWLSTNKGLSRLNPTSGAIRNYHKSDGLQGEQFYWGAVARGNQGDLYFGGINGVTAFYPEKIIDDTSVPKILLTDLKVLNKSVHVNEEVNKEVILEESINYSKSIELTHRDKVFTIEFSALSYSNADDIKYMYKLEGFDNEWTFTNNKKRNATYTNLPKGKYIFKVAAANSDGKWSKPTEMIIRLKPPIHKSLTFKILMFLTLGFLIYQSYQFRTKRIINLNLQLEEKVKERTEELMIMNEQLIVQSDEMTEINIDLEERQSQIEKQSSELKTQHKELQKINTIKDKLFSILAHDLKNPLNNVKGYIDLLIHRYDSYNDEKKKTIISSLNKSIDTIYELLINLLNWSNAQQGAITYDPKPCVLDDVIIENIQFIQPIANDKEISFHYKPISKNIKALIDRNLIDSVMRNILHNAFKYSFQGGNVYIETNTDDEMIEISVADQGIGIKKDSLSQLFNKERIDSTKGTKNEAGTGLGLIICKELIEIHKGQIWVESETGKGSKFSFTLKKA